jgi:hypothetical protein
MLFLNMFTCHFAKVFLSLTSYDEPPYSKDNLFHTQLDAATAITLPSILGASSHDTPT